MDVKTRAYVFKHKFIYVGWIVKYRPNDSIPYADNVKTITMHNEYDLPYMTIGFTEKRVVRKLSKYIERYPCKFDCVKGEVK